MTEKERQRLADLFRLRRIQLEMSLREVARLAGVDSATVMLLEQCRITHPRMETVRAIAAVLRLQLVDVYAAANWLPEGTLPSLKPYMRMKYGDLSEKQLQLIEGFVAELSAKRDGPKPGEDE